MSITPLRSKYDGKPDLDMPHDRASKGLVEAAGDPYTVYLTKIKLNHLDEQLNGSFSGIEPNLVKTGKYCSCFANCWFPGRKCRFKTKDIIVNIDGQDTTGLSVDEAVSVSAVKPAHLCETVRDQARRF